MESRYLEASKQVYNDNSVNIRIDRVIYIKLNMLNFTLDFIYISAVPTEFVSNLNMDCFA